MNEEFDEDDDYLDYAVRPNKSQIKRDTAVLFALGEELAVLSPAQLTALELPEPLHNAVAQAAGMPHKGARKRQLKYVCGLLRKHDAESIKEKLASMKNQSVHAVREHHRIERWRDRLISEGDDALGQLLSGYPQSDRQQLRLLIRNAQKEIEKAMPPKSSRELYRYLKGLFEMADSSAHSMD